ncbi:protein kinase [Streptomyces sp. NPDC101132]|uniref:serine/threonine-protein kinase n=1 Tax=Streptomyces sp. NPDC101132 TaxID=3366110 RepID=UPI00380E2238
MSAPGDVIDERFELLERLGSGGMGTVWRALDRALHREVALKEVRPVHGPGPDEGSGLLRERVLREARALARINHPHVVTIHHIVDRGPHPWLVMELLPGDTLQSRAERAPLTPAEAARTGREVLAGLRAAHAAGIHHRDVKPANVLLRADGSAVLTDFGIAALQDASSLTVTGEIIGTPEYLAPERIRGADLPACDLWSLAITLYVCVEGVSPMRRTTTLATLAAVLDEPVPAPRRAGALAPVLAAVLVRDPEARPDAETLDALLAAVASPGPGEPPAPPPPPPTQVDTPVPARELPGPRIAAPLPPPPAPRTPAPRPGPGPVAGPASAGGTPGPAGDTGQELTLGPGHPGTTRHEEPGRPARSGTRTPLAAAAAVVALALLGLGAYALADRGGRDPGGDAKGGTRPGTSAPATTAGPSTAPPTTPDGGPATQPGTEPATSPADAPSYDGSTGGGSAGTGTDGGTDGTGGGSGDGSLAGRWIAQLYSEPVASGTDARDRRLTAVRAAVPEAELLLSSDYASLRAGYWVVYAPGPFEDGRAALAFCAGRGRTSADACIGRWLSADPADGVYTCVPPASSPGGRCRRD